jgi:hypothetical protein
MAKRNADGDIIMTGDEDLSPVHRRPTNCNHDVAMLVTNEKTRPSTPTDDGIDVMVDSLSEDEKVLVLSPSEQKQ